MDGEGFVITGATAAHGQPALPFETDQPGVFAIGDVRAGSTKRVAAAVGEGSTVVGVLIEVPLMLSVVWIVNRSKPWYEARGVRAAAPEPRS